MTGTTKVLSIEDQPLASRVSTPVGGGPGQLGESSGSVKYDPSSPRRAAQQPPLLSHSQSSYQSQSQQSFKQQPIELSEKGQQQQNGELEPRLA